MPLSSVSPRVASSIAILSSRNHVAYKKLLLEIILSASNHSSNLRSKPLGSAPPRAFPSASSPRGHLLMPHPSALNSSILSAPPSSQPFLGPIHTEQWKTSTPPAVPNSPLPLHQNIRQSRNAHEHPKHAISVVSSAPLSSLSTSFL